MHRDYIKEHNRVLYTNLLTSGKLNTYLHEVDTRAKQQIDQTVESFAKADGTDETLKAYDQMKWVQLMNCYCQAADEIVLRNVVFV